MSQLLIQEQILVEDKPQVARSIKALKKPSAILREMNELGIKQCYGAFSNHYLSREVNGIKIMPDELTFCALGMIRKYYGWSGNIYDHNGLEEMAESLPHDIRNIVAEFNDLNKMPVLEIANWLEWNGY